MPQRRQKSTQGHLEDDLLKNQRWSCLHEQRRLQALHHTTEENQRAQDECRALVIGSYGALRDYIDWLELCGQK
mgnify:CR=1 FL=1